MTEVPASISLRIRGATKTALARFGVDIRRIQSPDQLLPVGDMRSFLAYLHQRGLEVRDLLDIGANRGDWSKMASLVFEGARVAMIEPQAEMSRYLNSFCRTHPGSTWVLAAAGATESQKDLILWPDLQGSSFLPPIDGEQNHPRHRTVPVVTVDDLVRTGAIQVPQIAKLDVQGFELEVLRGAGTLLGRTEVFIIETSLVRPLAGQPLIDEVIAFMRSSGYRVFDLAGFLRRPADGALGQIDVCFALEGGSLCRTENW